MGAFGGAVLFQGVEIASHGRLRHAQFADQLVECRKPANADDVEEPATTIVVLHGFTLSAGRSMTQS